MRMALEFSKTGTARYISHLDLQRAFSRAVRRSGLPVKLSEGFNPHYLISFASALSLGVQSTCECVEIVTSTDVSADEFLLSMARALPPGIEAKRAVQLKNSAPKLMAALSEAEYLLRVDGAVAEKVAKSIETLMARDEVMGVKISGGVEKPIEIRRMIISLAMIPEGLHMRLMATQTQTLKPDILLRVLEEETGPLGRDLTRTALYAYVDGAATDLLSAFAV